MGRSRHGSGEAIKSPAGNECARSFSALVELLDAGALCIALQQKPYADVMIAQGTRFDDVRAIFPEVPGVYVVPE